MHAIARQLLEAKPQSGKAAEQTDRDNWIHIGVIVPMIIIAIIIILIVILIVNVILKPIIILTRQLNSRTVATGFTSV